MRSTQLDSTGDNVPYCGEDTHAVTKEEAMTCRQFQSRMRFKEDGSPRFMCRASGACKTWKRDPERFKLPVKYGLYESFYITNENAHEWAVLK